MTTAERLIKISENVERVYEAGKKAEHDRFWDAYQQNGQRTDYQLAFGGTGWTRETFRPKYDIRPTSAFELFRGNTIEDSLPDILNECNVTLDTGAVNSGGNLFYNSAFTRIGVIDTRSMHTLSHVFYNCKKLKTIDSVLLREGGDQTFNNTFSGCSALENVTFSGVIGKSGLDFKSCVLLSRESIENIVGCLSDSASGLSITLSAAACAAFTPDEWQSLKNTKSNWEIILS